MAYSYSNRVSTDGLDLIRKVVDMTGQTNVVLTGGYALNCVVTIGILNNSKMGN